MQQFNPDAVAKRGGKRAGSGRKSTGRTKIVMYATPLEQQRLQGILTAMRLEPTKFQWEEDIWLSQFDMQGRLIQLGVDAKSAEDFNDAFCAEFNTTNPQILFVYSKLSKTGIRYQMTIMLERLEPTFSSHEYYYRIVNPYKIGAAL